MNNYGMLTIENIEEVVSRIEKMLTGKRYTFVAVNSFFANKDNTGKALFLMSTVAPTVRTSQEIKGNASIWKEENYAGFNFSDTYGVWGLSTSLKEDKYDHTFENPYFVFEGRQIRFYHRAPAGNSLTWVIAIEDE